MNSQKKKSICSILCFKKDNSANVTADEICTVYGNGATSIMTICN